MKLYKQWFLLVAAGILSSASFTIWPKMNNLDFRLKEDLITALLFKPFHYMSSFLLLTLTILILVELVSKIVYECKVAYLLKIVPYETLLLALITIYIYLKVIRFYPFLSTVLSVIFAFYYIVDYMYERKKQMITSN